MDTIQAILIFIVAGVLFSVYHKIFRVTYFGFQGMFVVGIICLMIAYWLSTFIFRS